VVSARQEREKKTLVGNKTVVDIHIHDNKTKKYQNIQSKLFSQPMPMSKARTENLVKGTAGPPSRNIGTAPGTARERQMK
jgi:hypothetical protein